MPASSTYFFDGKKVCKKTATNKKFRFDLPRISTPPGLSNLNFTHSWTPTRTSRYIYCEMKLYKYPFRNLKLNILSLNSKIS